MDKVERLYADFEQAEQSHMTIWLEIARLEIELSKSEIGRKYMLLSGKLKAAQERAKHARELVQLYWLTESVKEKI